MKATNTFESTRTQASELLQGYRITILITTAVELGVLDCAAGGTTLTELLARSPESNKAVMRNLLSALERHSLIQKMPDGPDRYEVTSVGRYFTKGGELEGLARLIPSAYLPAWSQLSATLTGGGIPFERAHGSDFWTYLLHNRSAAESFATCMAGNSTDAPVDLLLQMTIPGEGVIVDVGAGSGVTASAIAHHFPKAHVIAVEREGQYEQLVASLSASPEKAVSCRRGDMFNNLPTNGDFYIFESVLHNWPSIDATRALRYLHDCTSSDARCSIIERYKSLESSEGKSGRRPTSELEMFVLFGSEEYDYSMYTQIASEAGWQVDKVCFDSSGRFMGIELAKS